MNKSELTREVADKTGMKQVEAGKAVDAVLDTIATSLKKGDSVALAGFGTFQPKHREAREGRNPKDGKPVSIPARTSAAFKPASALKDL